ncbi:MAG TPA: metallophosphoesterase [Spirochaetota bacterium]|nr:metallophosphoesterase [Spirochaetota bacterium]
MKILKSLLAAVIILLALPLYAGEKLLTIIHTNDLHSHLMGFPPELDYTADKTGDDATLGGWARMATVIKRERAGRTNPSLVLDAGDFTMGSLFHMLAREEAIELSLMKRIGYDMVTLGNHEFDLMPGGLARILAAGVRKGMPEIVFSSAKFSAESAKDDTLEAAFKKGLVKPYSVRIVNGIKIGFFGIMGEVAIGDAPFASPVKFTPPLEAAREMVKVLREKEKVDMVICLSHSGLYLGSKSEDEVLAREVKGIDIIVSGHTHTLLEKPLVVNNTIIVQAWEHGTRVGVLDVAWNDGKAAIKNYKMITVDDSIPADRDIQRRIDSYIGDIDRRVLKEYGLSYWKIIARTGFDMPIIEDESPLGNLIADSIRWYVNKYDYDPADPVTKVVASIEANGVIRDSLFKGKTGNLAVADIFRTIPLGIGMDDTMAYPLVSCYLYGSELKKAMEILTSVYPLKGSAYFLQISGIRFSYNPRRAIFDRVTEIWIGSEEDGYVPLDYSSSNKTLYRIAANIYDTTFLKVIGGFTFNILTIIPKDRQGNPISDLVAHRVDADKRKPGIQELKEWVGLMEFIKRFPDLNSDGLADVPEKYRGALGRIVKAPSLNPFNLLSRGTAVTWVIFGIFVLILSLTAFTTRFFIKKFRK